MDPGAERVAEAIGPAIESEGYALVDVELKGKRGSRVLRLFIDKPEGGITLDDCQRVSEVVGPMLDVQNIIDGRYYLEVSSPGINRRIRTKADFEKYVKSKVTIHTRSPIDGSRKITGVIEGVEGAEILVRRNRSGSESVSRVPLEAIDRANLQVI